MITARDLMTPAPATIPATTHVRDAVVLLQTLHVRHLPVVDDKMKVVGMFSDQALRAFYLQPQGNVSHDTRVGSILAKPVRSVRENMLATDVVDLLLDDNVGAVAVTDAKGCVVGIISYVDVLRALALGGETMEAWG